jgi:hypothetical protein
MSLPKRKFSVHPKLAAAVDLLLNLGTLLLFPKLTGWQWFAAWFVVRAVLWALFIRLVYYPPELSRWRHFWSLIFFNFGVIVALSIFIEWTVAWYLLAAVFVIFSAASFWLLPSGESSLAFYRKPFRRWLFLMDAFGLAGFWCGVFALIQFQLWQNTFYPFLEFLGALMTAAVSLWWWRAYGMEYSRRFWLSLAVIFLLTFELAWIVTRWPIGFLVSGMVMIWFWYIWWLVMRFNLSKEGIDWKKQKFFLVSSLILFILFMLLARWR